MAYRNPSLAVAPALFSDFALLPLRLYYQPIIELAGEGLFAHECLLRLELSDGRVLSPAGFLAGLEHAGMMADVTRWVIASAVETLSRRPDMSLFVNLDRDSFGNYGILDYTADVLDARGIGHARLGFEISEQTIIGNHSNGARWLSAAKQLGLRLALDDFGGGEFTLEHLLSLPTDAIKVDRLLTQRLYLGENPGLLKTLTSIASWHAKPLVLEGIASPGMVAFALEHGIHLGQGYHLGKPAPLSEAGMPRMPELAVL